MGIPTCATPSPGVSAAPEGSCPSLLPWTEACSLARGGCRDWGGAGERGWGMSGCLGHQSLLQDLFLIHPLSTGNGTVWDLWQNSQWGKISVTNPKELWELMCPEFVPTMPLPLSPISGDTFHSLHFGASFVPCWRSLEPLPGHGTPGTASMGTFPALGAAQPRRPLGLQPPKFPSIFLVSFRSVALGAAPPSQHWGKDRFSLAEAMMSPWSPSPG